MILKVPTAIFRLAVYLVVWQCFAAASRHRFADDHEVLATTNQGVVRGISVHKDVNAYLGIPFAQPPIGSLRFMPPQPLTNASLSESGKHIYNATKFGPVCYQFHYRTVMGDALAETTGQSEDCLTLNIFAPKRSHSACSPRKKPLPVFVWSFGGAFGEGGGSMPMFNPTNFVAENKDIIVVTWNYRTTLFGFPNSPALDYQNLGIRDQRIALEWVRDNISGFGGDPGRIVLGGHSSGADSGNAMLYSHADDPIAVAVAFQSGSVQVIGPSLHDHDLEFVRVAEAVGCADATNRTRELECMRRVDAKNLHLAISNRTLNTFGSLPGGAPMVDNVTLFTVQEYDRRGRAGKFAQLPTLIGGLEDEGDGISNWSEKCGINKTNSDIISAVVLNCNIALETKYRYMNDVPTWRYRYMGVFPEVTPYKWLGSYHESDVAMLMGTYNTINNTRSPGQTTTAAASRYYQQLFGTFIRNPATGLQDVYGWPTFNPNRKTLVQLFHKNAVGAQLINPHRYDDICSHPPPLSWEAVAAPPPSC